MRKAGGGRSKFNRENVSTADENAGFGNVRQRGFIEIRARAAVESWMSPVGDPCRPCLRSTTAEECVHIYMTFPKRETFKAI